MLLLNSAAVLVACFVTQAIQMHTNKQQGYLA